jgi:hypothetical protein
MKHPHARLLSSFLDGDLSPSEILDLEEHFRVCASCSDLLRDLQDLRLQARELPDHLPPRDLWPDIADAISRVDRTHPDVIRLHPERSRGHWPRVRRYQLSLPQAVAAGLVLALFSGLVGARVGAGGTQEGDPVAWESVQRGSPSWVSLVATARPALEGRAMEIARMERTLAERRGEMDPVTVEILEKNLAAVDRAIRESVSALEADPDNRFLAAHLERALQTRGEYLRDATLLVLPAS